MPMLDKAAPPRHPIRQRDGSYIEPPPDFGSPASLGRVLAGLAAAAFFIVCVRVSEVDPGSLLRGLPRLAHWAATAWPPYVDDVGVFLYRAFETLAVASVATATAAVMALPLSLLIARTTAPSGCIMLLCRWLANACRAIDTVIFAILFVAAVGLGPFAGVLGMVVHSLGVIAKLNAEAIETLPEAPIEAAAMSGAGRIKLVSYAVVPLCIPRLSSNALYVWEANVRTSTVLGIVGAGGIGTEIKAAIDLLDFNKLLTLSAIVLVMVTVIDQLSAGLRRRLA
jgi:phosphonate transport system permease protein